MSLKPNITLDQLRAVRALVERGWCQGAYWREETSGWIFRRRQKRYCLVGAIREAAGTLMAELTPAYLALVRAFPANESLVVWNDEPGRTREQVLAKIDEAIAGVGG